MIHDATAKVNIDDLRFRYIEESLTNSWVNNKSGRGTVFMTGAAGLKLFNDMITKELQKGYPSFLKDAKEDDTSLCTDPPTGSLLKILTTSPGTNPIHDTQRKRKNK